MMADAGEEEKFFPGLVAGLRALQAEGDAMSTMTVVAMMEKILRVFDYLGSVFAFAKPDMTTKCESLRVASSEQPMLKGVVDADIQAGVAAVKNSCARNLHRLTTVIKFLRLFLEQLLADPATQLKDAAGKAYTESLAPIHTFVVRNTVRAGMYMLPTRAQFMAKIGEDETSARGAAEEFVGGICKVEATILALFDGVDMPGS